MATLSTIEYTANPEAPAFNMGANVKKVYGSYAKTAALPTDADLLILARNLPLSAVIHKISLTHVAIAGFTDADIVLLDSDGSVIKNSSNAVVYLAEALSFANARANENVLSALQQSLKALIGYGGDKLAPSVSIALLVNTAGSKTGTISYDIEYSTPF